MHSQIYYKFISNYGADYRTGTKMKEPVSHLFLIVWPAHSITLKITFSVYGDTLVWYASFLGIHDTECIIATAYIMYSIM